MNKLIFSLMLLFLISLSSVNAAYYYERTESRSPDGSYSSKEIEFRGSVSGYAEDDYRERRSCSRSDYRRSYVNRYYGRGYSDRCSGRYYSRPSTRDSRYDDRDIVTDSYYNYRGRDTIRISRY